MRHFLFRLTALSAVLIFILLAASSCLGSGAAASNLPEPSYSSDITENLLLALNESDFNRFSLDFDEGMKKAVTPESFNTQFVANIKGNIGDYVPGSKRFFSSAQQDQYTTVVYFTTYTNEPGAVLVQISFQPVEGKPLISGIFYNSPKLRS